MIKLAALAFATAGLTVALVGIDSGAALPAAEQGKTLVAKPTYAEHVAPILNARCVSCHRPGEVAPFSLIGFENAKKWAPMIHTVTQAKRMPPWKAVEGYGEFRDASLLSPVEIETLKRWSDGGSPRGDTKLEPKSPTFSSEWALGKPDMVITPPKAYTVPSEGTDEYRNFVVKTDWKEPMWVTAMDVKPGNAKVVHHVIAFLDNKGQGAKLEAKNTDGRPGYATFGGVGFAPDGSLGGWAPGFRTRLSEPGTAFRVEPGASIVLQIHYNMTGKPETDQTKVGLYFAKERVKQEIELGWLLQWRLRIPAGEKAHRETYEMKVPADITMYNVMPHMHLLGRSMKAWVEKPDGSKLPLIHIADWDFNWQLGYAFKEPIKIAAGSKVMVESIYDNSVGNPNNPSSPPKLVTFGERTTDEMMLLIAAFTVDGKSARN